MFDEQQIIESANSCDSLEFVEHIYIWGLKRGKNLADKQEDVNCYGNFFSDMQIFIENLRECKFSKKNRFHCSAFQI